MLTQPIIQREKPLKRNVYLKDNKRFCCEPETFNTRAGDKQTSPLIILAVCPLRERSLEVITLRSVSQKARSRGQGARRNVDSENDEKKLRGRERKKASKRKKLMPQANLLRLPIGVVGKYSVCWCCCCSKKTE